jgi:hypothetical protein
VHFLNDLVEVATTDEGRHAVTLTDPDLGPDAPPAVEFEAGDLELDALYFGLRDYKLGQNNMKRVEIEAKDLVPGDILYEFGMAVYTVRHVIGSTQPDVYEVDDFIIAFGDAKGMISVRLPILHKITVNRHLEGPRLSG